MTVSGSVFEGVAKLLDTLLKAARRISDGLDQSKRRNAIRDLIAVSLLANEIVRDGKSLLKRAGSDPVGKVTQMNAEERWAYARECCGLLSEQLDRLRRLSGLLDDAPLLEILDANLRCELDSIIGSKEEGLLAIVSPLGIYLTLGPLPDDAEVEKYGMELARMRYQADIVLCLLTNQDASVNSRIELDVAVANLNELSNASKRLLDHINGVASREEIVLLTKAAQERARE
jgi:hypothetical protein